MIAAVVVAIAVSVAIAGATGNNAPAGYNDPDTLANYLYGTFNATAPAGAPQVSSVRCSQSIPPR